MSGASARDKVLQPDASMTFTIGIISDTHGLLRPEALRVLAHVDHIVHGGDIGDPEIITALRRVPQSRR
jgi:predicted phosphodiesterase